MLTRLHRLRLQSPVSPQMNPRQTNLLLILPEELLAHLLTFLSPTDCGQLSLTSTLVRDRLLGWLGSSSCLQQCSVGLSGLLDQQTTFDHWIVICQKYGVLCKRVSMLYCTDQRLTQLVSWFRRLEVRGCSQLGKPWAKVCGRAGLAAALQSFTLGWDEAELVKVVSRLREMFPVLQMLGHVSGWKSVISDNVLSCEVRSVLRTFFWDWVPDEPAHNWLSLTLNSFLPTDLTHTMLPRYMAQLLFLMLGPADDSQAFIPDTLSHFTSFQWSVYTNLLCPVDRLWLQDQVPDSYTEAKEVFSDLGKGLRLLNRTCFRLHIPNILSALFEGNWMEDNQAACLLFSSEPVVQLHLKMISRGKEGMMRLANILVAMVLVCGRFNNDLKQGLGNILDWAFTLPSTKERQLLVKEFWREVTGRLEEDFGDEILIQLGVHVGMRAFVNEKDNGALREQALEE